MKKMKKIAVLMGGWSGEREVSLTSAKGVIHALTQQGYDVKAIDVTRDITKLVNDLSYGPDVVFLSAIHGRWVEDGRLQGLLEMMGLPDTNSGVAASANAMDKVLARVFFASANLPYPKGCVVTRADLQTVDISFPAVIKPLSEGSSLGVQMIASRTELLAAEDVWRYGAQALLEEYIPGRELHIAVMGGKALGVVEIQCANGFYDYDAKYTAGRATHLMPAPISHEAYKEALDLATKAYICLGCEGVARVDMRYNDTDQGPKGLYLLEVNTQPGMTPLSLVPEIAAHVGIPFSDLVNWIAENPITAHV